MTNLLNKSDFELKTLKEIANDAIDKLKDGIGSGTTGADLHNDLFNSDYYIIGYYKAEQWLINNTGVFNGISIVQEYEKNNFGEVNTDLSSSEKVVNMLVYIAGEEVLSISQTLQDNWNNRLSDEDIQAIINELEEEFNS
jgi:hypothetical protein